MISFKECIVRLNNYARAVHQAIVILAVVEVVLIIIIGILSNQLDTNLSKLFLLFVSILYVSLVSIRVIYGINYPSTIVNEMWAERELEKLKVLTNRQSQISYCYVETMRNLNIQTCKLDEENESRLCDVGIKDSLKELIFPIIEKSYYLLDTDKGNNCTFGLHLNGYTSIDINDNDSGIIVIYDELTKLSCLPKKLLQENNIDGEALEIQKIIRTSLNNKIFNVQDYNYSNKLHNVFCSPMYEACRENDNTSKLLGVFFIITEKLDDIPLDIETQMKIFNRIIANWIYRYNECVVSKKLDKIKCT
jgi:hypothetical protein